MIRHPGVTGAILAGGEARRLGGINKALLPLGTGPDATPLARILAVFEGRFADCIVAGGDPGDLSGLPVRHVADRRPGLGPLEGLRAALEATHTAFAFVCACDMPFLSGALIDFMAERARDGRALVPRRSGRVEPLHAIYPAACLPRIQEALEAGERMLRDLHDRIPVDHLDDSVFAGVPGADRSFDNLNTPDDVAAARSRSGRIRR